MQFENTNKDVEKLSKSVCEVNIDGKMALVSLYDDLPHFEYDLTIDNLKNSNSKLLAKIVELKLVISKLEKENSKFKSNNTILSNNITSLYKTATSEIQRKDKIINELRKSQVHTPPKSNIFSSSHNLQFKDIQYNRLPEKKQSMEKLKENFEQSKIQNQNLNNSVNNINTVIKPDHNIPKTIYYKRLCQKLILGNEVNQIPSKPKEINCITVSNKISQEENHSMDTHILKEMSTLPVHNDSKEDLNTTLVICESDVTPSDCELDSSLVNLNKHSEKGKENESSQLFSSELKQTVKSKKKLIIAPATIGIKNMSIKPLKCLEKSYNNTDVDIKTQPIIKESPEKKVLKSFSKNTMPICNKKHNLKCDSNSNNKLLLRTAEVDNKKLYISENKNKIPLINIEVEQYPFTRRKKIVEKNSNPQVPTKANESSCATFIQSSCDNDFNTTTKNVKCLSVNSINELSSPNYQNNQLKYKLLDNSQTNNSTKFSPSNNSKLNTSLKNINHLSFNDKRKSSSPLEQKSNLLESEMPITNNINNLTIFPLTNNSVKCSSESPSIEQLSTNKTDGPSINIEVEQGSIFKRSKRKVIMHLSSDSNKQEIKKGRRVQLITIKDHYSEPLPSFNGAIKTDIDVSKKSIHIEKVVESSSHFYVPTVKRRRTMNFSNSDP